MWKWLKTKQSGFMGFNGIKVRSAPWRRGDRDRTDAPLPSPPPHTSFRSGARARVVRAGARCSLPLAAH